MDENSSNASQQIEVDIGGRRKALGAQWSRPFLQDHLLKIGLTLTRAEASTGQDISATHSLAICLLQHSLQCYNGFRSLDEAWDTSRQ